MVQQSAIYTVVMMQSCTTKCCSNFFRVIVSFNCHTTLAIEVDKTDAEAC
jgi:hypothetical protein